MVPFRAGGLEYFPAIPNPVGIPALNEAVFEAFAFVTFIVILLATISLPVRFRRARGDERQQLKWVAYAAVFLGVVGVVSPRWAPPGQRVCRDPGVYGPCRRDWGGDPQVPVV